jgi:outer membrane biogenesis lipoprotein LolB
MMKPARAPFVLCSLFFVLSACAARTPPRPVGTATPDPTAAEAFATATAACKGFRSIEGELSLSGRAGGERVRGRILTGLESGGAVRLEAVAPFGAPFFVLAGRDERATLVLPREHRVLKDTGVSEVLERLTGLSLGADDLRFIVSGCLVERAAPSEGRQWPGEWRAVTIGPDRIAYVRLQNGQPVVVAADYGRWHVDYSAHASGFPRVVRVRRAGVVAPADQIDIIARIDQLEVNTQINPRAWVVEIPSDAEPMTLDELRSIAPLAEKK